MSTTGSSDILIIGSGVAGPITTKILAAYRKMVRQ